MSLLFLVSFNLRYIVCITKITKDIVAKNFNFINPYNKTSINLLSFVITKILKLPLSSEIINLHERANGLWNLKY